MTTRATTPAITPATAPFHRYVALGDSFTEGVGDPDPDRPNGLRGWADRVAEALATQSDDFRYANLAIRGRKLPQILAEQVDPALALVRGEQDVLVTIHGGGNDVLRPKLDIDALARSYGESIGRLQDAGATVLMFTLPDVATNPAFKVVRGRIAIFNEWVHEIADTQGVLLVDMWRNHTYDPRQTLDDDRLHLNPSGHQDMAISVLNALGVRHDLLPHPPKEVPTLSPREALEDNLRWARTHFVPWIRRRVTGRSSGDGVEPKYPVLTPVG